MADEPIKPDDNDNPTEKIDRSEFLTGESGVGESGVTDTLRQEVSDTLAKMDIQTGGSRLRRLIVIFVVVVVIVGAAASVIIKNKQLSRVSRMDDQISADASSSVVVDGPDFKQPDDALPDDQQADWEIKAVPDAAQPNLAESDDFQEPIDPKDFQLDREEPAMQLEPKDQEPQVEKKVEDQLAVLEEDLPSIDQELDPQQPDADAQPGVDIQPIDDLPPIEDLPVEPVAQPSKEQPVQVAAVKVEQPATPPASREQASDIDGIMAKAGIAKPLRQQLAPIIAAESRAAELDPIFVSALIMAESSFNPEIVSESGKIGLLQISPEKEKLILKLSGKQKAADSKLTDPAYNLKLGLWYIKFLEFFYQGNIEQALVGNEMGVKNFARYQTSNKALPEFTLRYLRNVSTFHGDWSAGRPDIVPLNFTYLSAAGAKPTQTAKETAPAEASPVAAAPAKKVQVAAKDPKTVNKLAKIMLPTGMNKTERRKLADLIAKESVKAGIDPFLAAAIVMSESSFISSVVSNEGKVGLMQIAPERGAKMAKQINAKWIGPELLKNPQYNLEVGFGYLSLMLQKYGGNFEQALLAYNLGSGSLDNIVSGNEQLPPLASRYVNNVYRFMQEWGGRVPEGSSFVPKLAAK